MYTNYTFKNASFIFCIIFKQKFNLSFFHHYQWIIKNTFYIHLNMYIILNIQLFFFNLNKIQIQNNR